MMRIFFSAVFLLGACACPALAFDLTIITQSPQQIPFQLVSANPYDRQTVNAPRHYVLRFSQPVRPDRSSIKIMDSFGVRVNGEALESDGLSLTTALPVLPPGRYTVKWQTRCQCDAEVVLSETYHFSVN